MRIPLRATILAAALVLAGCSLPDLSSGSASPSVSPAPLKCAQCDQGFVPPSGSLPQGDGTTTPITHSAVTCGGVFLERVDLTNLGNNPNCLPDVSEVQDPDHGRPCSLPTRSFPDFAPSFVSGNKDLWPTEGKLLGVICQITGDHVPSRGTIQNASGERTNVWNFISDARFPKDKELLRLTGYPQGYFLSDLWMGNAGWRNLPCAIS